jgi:endonuclease-3
MTYQYIPFMAKIIRAQRAKKTQVRSLPKKTAKAKAKLKPKPKAKLKAKPQAKSARPARKSRAPQPKPWTPEEVREVFERFRKANPEPRGELEHLNPFTLLVAVVLSAQATDAGVNRATRELFKVADTPQKMLELGEEKLRDYIKTIGL